MNTDIIVWRVDLPMFISFLLKVIDATDNMDLSWDIDVLTYLIIISYDYEGIT